MLRSESTSILPSSVSSRTLCAPSMILMEEAPLAQWAAVSTHLGYFEQILVIRMVVEMMIKMVVEIVVKVVVEMVVKMVVEMVVKVVVKIEAETHSSEIRVPPQNHCSSTKRAAIQGKE